MFLNFSVHKIYQNQRHFITQFLRKIKNCFCFFLENRKQRMTSLNNIKPFVKNCLNSFYMKYNPKYDSLEFQGKNYRD